MTMTEGSPVGLNRDLWAHVPDACRALYEQDAQRSIPAIAKNAELSGLVEAAVRNVPTTHRLVVGDSRQMDHVPDESVHLIVTSPPYWTLKDYLPHEAQLGAVEDYDDFLDQLDEVWKHCFRVLVPGGRMVVVVGDVCLSRKAFGRHVVFPLHASIQERCRAVGFDNLAPIIWHKIANAVFEVDGPGAFLGKPYEPGSVIKNDIEFVLFERKPGGYRSPSGAARVLSAIPEDRHHEWFQQVWLGLTGASTREHPAPFPLALAERLVRMFSFVGDTVLDPFMGTGTTNVAAGTWGRDSIGVELHDEYFEMAERRVAELGTVQLQLGV